jgi:hypothetical protein
MIEGSSQPVGANFFNTTSTEPLTFVDEDTWTVYLERGLEVGDNPTEIVRCLECRGKAAYADMSRVYVVVNVMTVYRDSHMQLRRVENNMTSSVK